MHFIGMDVHSKVTMICVLDENGKKVEERVVKGPLGHLVGTLRLLGKEFGRARLCFEASTGCGWLRDELCNLEYQVQVAHPGKVRMIFRAKRKNDRIDAYKLALLAFLDQVPLAHIPSAACRQWRSLIEYRQKLIGQRAAAKCRLRAILRSNALVAPRSLWSKAGRAWVAQQKLGLCQGLQRDQLLMELEELRTKVRQVERMLGQVAREAPAVGLLMTIPGVGIRTAEAVVAYIDDPGRFSRIKSVGCYFGMVPCEDTSVKSRLGHITKEGPGTVRKLLTEATWQGIRRDPAIREYFQRVCRNDPKRRRIALVATAHHLLRVMLAMLRTGECWRATAA